MPMVRHHAVRKNCDVELRARLFEGVFERSVIVVGGEQLGALGRAIDDVEHEPCGCDA